MHERFVLSRSRLRSICPNPRATCGVSLKLLLLFNTDGAAFELIISLHPIYLHQFRKASSPLRFFNRVGLAGFDLRFLLTNLVFL